MKFQHHLLLLLLLVIAAALPILGCGDDDDDDDSGGPAVDNDDDDSTTDDDDDDDTTDDDDDDSILTLVSKDPTEDTVSQDVGTTMDFTVEVTSTIADATLTYDWQLDGASLGGAEATYALALIADYVQTSVEMMVRVSDGTSTLDVPWTVTVNSIDHADMELSFTGPETCATCHPNALGQIMGSVHYSFQSHTPEDYIKLLDESGEWTGDYLDDEFTGKLHKLCAFPHAYAGANWIGILNATEETPGGCGRCHIGNGTPPPSLTGDTKATDEQRNSIDCLICHAQNYQPANAPNRYPEKIYEDPATDPFGTWTSGLRFPFDTRVEAFQSVGKPDEVTCLRCHNFAGGGFHAKRGAGFDFANDVHHNGGVSCVDCHSAGDHRTKRGDANVDTWSYDNQMSGSTCETCHGDAPHTGGMYNSHVDSISCQTCHVSREGCCGVTYKDFTDWSSYDATKGIYNAYTEVESGNAENVVYTWYDGFAYKPLIPLGEKNVDKIYPFKKVTVRKVVDEDGNPVSLKLGYLFKNGMAETDADSNGIDDNVDMAAKLGYKLGKVVGGPENPTFDPATDPSPLVGYADEEEYFNLDHGITKDDALTCTDCHSESLGLMDWTALGIDNPNPMP